MKVTKARLALVTLLAVTATACGDDDSDGQDSTTEEASSPATEPAASETAAGSSATEPPPSDPATSETSSTEAYSSVALEGFELADYIKEHVANGDTLKFVYLTNDVSSSYTESQRAGVEKAVAELGVDAELSGAPTGAAEDQVSLIQTLIAQKQVDGIAVAAVNVDSLKPVIQSAFDAGIPFISVFTDQPNSKQLAFVGADNEALGRREGEMLAELLADKEGKVIGLSVDTAAGWSTQRMDGLKAGLATNPGLEFVGPVNTGIEAGQMYNAIQNAMQADPDALALASVDCCSVTGAAKWVSEAGKSGEVVVIGTDALQQTLDYILDGTISFTISQDPVMQVFTAISQLNEFVTNGTPPTTTIIEPLIVNKDNAATVTPEG
jgi:simple sugar transport system substrate-binding protein/ribose transport system substrate-binding protein